MRSASPIAWRAAPSWPSRGVADEHRLDLGAEGREVLDAHLRPDAEGLLAVRRRRGRQDRRRAAGVGRWHRAARGRTLPSARGTLRRRRAPRVRARPQHRAGRGSAIPTGRTGWPSGHTSIDAVTRRPVTKAQRWTMLAAILGTSMVFLDGTIVNLALPHIGARAAGDPRLDARGPDLRRRRLPRDPRRAAAPRRRPRRLLRPAADVRDRPHRVRDHVRAVRPGADPRAARRRPPAPGRRRGAARARLARDHHGDVRGRGAAGAGDRALGGGDIGDRADRTRDRRRARRHRQLAGGLPDQRAARDRSPCSRLRHMAETQGRATRRRGSTGWGRGSRSWPSAASRSARSAARSAAGRTRSRGRALVIGAVALVAFPFLMARRPHPLVPLGLFRRRQFATINLSTLLIYGAAVHDGLPPGPVPAERRSATRRPPRG